MTKKRKNPCSLEAASIEGSLQSIDMQLDNLNTKLSLIFDEMHLYIETLEKFHIGNTRDFERNRVCCFGKKLAIKSLAEELNVPNKKTCNKLIDCEFQCYQMQAIVFESLKSKKVLVEKVKSMISEIDFMKKNVAQSEEKYLSSLSSKFCIFSKSQKRVQRLQERRDNTKVNLTHQLSRIKLQSNVLLNHELFIQPDVSLFNGVMTWRHLILSSRVSLNNNNNSNFEKTSLNLQKCIKNLIRNQKLKNQEVMKQLININNSYTVDQQKKTSLNPFNIMKNQRNKKGNELYHVLFSLEDLTSPKTSTINEEKDYFDYLPISDSKLSQRVASFSSQDSASSEEEVAVGAEFKGYMNLGESDDLIDTSYLIRT